MFARLQGFVRVAIADSLLVAVVSPNQDRRMIAVHFRQFLPLGKQG